jgi:hypothetical protein
MEDLSVDFRLDPDRDQRSINLLFLFANFAVRERIDVPEETSNGSRSPIKLMPGLGMGDASKKYPVAEYGNPGLFADALLGIADAPKKYPGAE